MNTHKHLISKGFSRSLRLLGKDHYVRMSQTPKKIFKDHVIVSKDGWEHRRETSKISGKVANYTTSKKEGSGKDFKHFEKHFSKYGSNVSENFVISIVEELLKGKQCQNVILKKYQ